MKRQTCAWTLAAVAGMLGGVAAGETLTLATKNLTFAIESDATAARFVMPANGKTDGDFWRLVLDDGERVEMPVFSRRQKGRAVREGENRLRIEYDEVKTEYGDTYPVRFVLAVLKPGELKFVVGKAQPRCLHPILGVVL